MTITVYEFQSIDPRTGDPIHPPTTTTRDYALDSNFVCQKTTVLAQVVPSSNVRLMTGGSPTATDYYCAANGMATIRLSAPQTTGTIIRATAG